MSSETTAPVVAALSIYVEPLADDARVAVLGDASLGLHEVLLDRGARAVHLFDPDAARAARVAAEVPRGVSVRALRDELEVRDSAFDLVVIPDLGELPDVASVVGRLRRVLDPRGAVVAMGRARTAPTDPSQRDLAALLTPPAPAFEALAPAALDYAALYDLFALEFESVTMNGVLPFTGVVFAELGAGDDLAVSVDTRLAAQAPPGVFVVVAGRDASALDPYAIVQVPDEADHGPKTRAVEAEDFTAAFAAMQLRAEMLETQLDDHRARLAAALESPRADEVLRLEQMALEREVALSRASELEGILGAAQQALGTLERRLLGAEQGMLERDDRIASLSAELDAVGERAAVAALAAKTAAALEDLARVEEAHAAEVSALEGQLQERAGVVHAMQSELARREEMVRELVSTLGEIRDGHAVRTFEAIPVAPGISSEEAVRLRAKLDELALEIARREGERLAQRWRIAELEALLGGRARDASPSPSATPSAASERQLARAMDEIDTLRQALTQEHAARVAAESGEELTRAREELARQAALLDQVRGRHPEGRS